MHALARLVEGPLVGLGLLVGALLQASAAGTEAGDATWLRLSALHVEFAVSNGDSSDAGASTIALQDAVMFATLQTFVLAGLAAGARATSRPTSRAAAMVASLRARSEVTGP
jgi:hypothetical protein